MPNISIIVPIYNADKYLEKCLDSIMNQTYNNFEVILVNDGSTDNSGEICERYASIDKRAKVIHKKENQGLISARIDGIQNAVSEYIGFVDADDWIDEDFFEILAMNMEQNDADIVISGCTKEQGGYSVGVKNNVTTGVYFGKSLLNIYPKILHYDGFYNFGILPYLWNKLYRRQLLYTCYKDIDTYISDGEDVAVVFPYLLRAQKVVVTNESKYHYRLHPQSMTAKKNKDFYENVSRLYLHLKKEFQKTDYYEMMLPQLDQYMRMMIWQGNPESFIDAEKHLFPFDRIPRGAKIILYGAGRVGKTYHHQICLSGYCKIVAWVDKGKEADNQDIKGVGVISSEVFDYIVIAVENKKTQKDIYKELEKIGIKCEKIVI